MTSIKKIDENRQYIDEILEASAESEEIEAKRTNIILYRVVDSECVLGNERNQEDERFCRQFLFALNAGICDEDIRKQNLM